MDLMVGMLSNMRWRWLEGTVSFLCRSTCRGRRSRVWGRSFLQHDLLVSGQVIKIFFLNDFSILFSVPQLPVLTARASVKLELCQKIAQGVLVRITKSPELFETSKIILSLELLCTNMDTMIKSVKLTEVDAIGKFLQYFIWLKALAQSLTNFVCLMSTLQMTAF